MAFLEHKRENIQILIFSMENEGTMSEGPLQKTPVETLAITPTTKTLNSKKQMVNNSYLLFLFIEYLEFSNVITIYLF